MALGDLTKQLAQQALLSATAKEPAAPPAPENIGAMILGQLSAMQKAVKDDEELAVFFQNGGEKIRVMEIFMPSWKVAVLMGQDPDRHLTRVISPVESLQLISKVLKVPTGVKPVRVGLFTPKPKDSSG